MKFILALTLLFSISLSSLASTAFQDVYKVGLIFRNFDLLKSDKELEEFKEQIINESENPNQFASDLYSAFMFSRISLKESDQNSLEFAFKRARNSDLKVFIQSFHIAFSKISEGGLELDSKDAAKLASRAIASGDAKKYLKNEKDNYKKLAGTLSQKRIDKDLSLGKPVVIHINVALVDNLSQAIAPINSSIANGDEPSTNLYWGARFGLKTFMIKDANWKVVKQKRTDKNKNILERIVLFKNIKRNRKYSPTYIVADAWKGSAIVDSVESFLKMSAGNIKEEIIVLNQNKEVNLSAASKSHLVTFIGHNVLMDHNVLGINNRLRNMMLPKIYKKAENLAKSSMVFACKSRPYFEERLARLGTHPLLTTNWNMAPEAYSVNAAIEAWVSGRSAKEVYNSATKSYAKFQKLKLKNAKGLFHFNK